MSRKARALLPVGLGTVPRAGLAVFIAAVIGVLPGCSETEYPRSSPEEMVDSAGQMLRNGDAERLAELVFTSDRRATALRREVGRVFGNLDALSVAVNEQYAAEITDLRDRVARGEADEIGLGPIIASAIEASNSEGGVGFGPLGAGSGQTPADLVAQILADPYGWLTSATDPETTKLDIAEIDDDLVALTWDDQPILPPVGIVLERVGDEWYWLPPYELLPGALRPDTDDEYAIWASLLRVVDNLLVDLREQLEAGKHRTLDDLARAAGEQVFIPAVLVFYAYTRAVQEEREQERASGG